MSNSYAYPRRKKEPESSRSKEVALGMSAATVLAVVAVGIAGLPGMATLPIAWAGAVYANRKPRTTPKANPRTTSFVVGVVGVGAALGVGSLEMMPTFTSIGFAAGSLLPFLNDEIGRRLSGYRNTTAKQADIVFVERRPPRPKSR